MKQIVGIVFLGAFISTIAKSACIDLVAAAGKVVTWRQFLRETQPFSIALDGYVHGRPMRDLRRRRANYDHHHDVDRVATRSTSEQVYMEIGLGLFEAFRRDGVPYAKVYVNDCDEDTCLAVWLLQNHERVLNNAEPLINKLVYLEDRLDTTAGMYPFNESAALRNLNWIFEPYTSVRSAGRLGKITSGEIKTIIEAVGKRIDAYSVGNSGSLVLDNQFQTVGGGRNWTFISDAGPFARMRLAHGGISAYVLKIADGRYSIGRMCWIPFPLDELYQLLNSAEPEGLITATNRWGGSDIVGGSPRETGSKLAVKEIEAILNPFLERWLTSHGF